MEVRRRLFGVDLNFHTGVHTQVMVRSCLSPALRAKVALTIMYGTAKDLKHGKTQFSSTGIPIVVLALRTYFLI